MSKRYLPEGLKHTSEIYELLQDRYMHRLNGAQWSGRGLVAEGNQAISSAYPVRPVMPPGLRLREGFTRADQEPLEFVALSSSPARRSARMRISDGLRSASVFQACWA